MNEHPKCLLVIELQEFEKDSLLASIRPLVDSLLMPWKILPGDMLSLGQANQAALLEAMHRQTEALERHTQVLTALVAAMAGEMVSDPDVAASVGLNGRPAL